MLSRVLAGETFSRAPAGENFLDMEVDPNGDRAFERTSWTTTHFFPERYTGEQKMVHDMEPFDQYVVSLYWAST